MEGLSTWWVLYITQYQEIKEKPSNFVYQFMIGILYVRCRILERKIVVQKKLYNPKLFIPLITLKKYSYNVWFWKTFLRTFYFYFPFVIMVYKLLCSLIMVTSLGWYIRETTVCHKLLKVTKNFTLCKNHIICMHKHTFACRFFLELCIDMCIQTLQLMKEVFVNRSH